MTRDPLYRRILEALDGDLDDDLFERCASDLLRDVYPSLVPMVGGDDAGYDGAIGTSSGAFPLLSTTDRRGPLANLRKNLKRYLAAECGPKLAVIATPRVVSNRKRRNLEAIASQVFGVRIVNVHEQTDFANRLYRDARWRFELLRLSGHPEALSALPLRSRNEEPPLIGRDDDLNWLRTATGDLLLVGQPGLGKTYLHQALVRDGTALFAVDSDPERLANALRAECPRIVVVDDAQDYLNLIRVLQRLRSELGLSFDLHANCWSREQEAVRATMDLPSTNIRHLEPLTREEIVVISNALGVFGPDQLLHVLLDQAEGKPGLLVALIAALKRGELERVWSGETLAEALLHGRQLLREMHDLPVLAALALGGELGVSVVEVATALGISKVQVGSTVRSLAAGGVVEEVFGTADHRLGIRPPALRGVLVRDAFFKGTGRLDASDLVERLRVDPKRISGLASSLLAARQRGAEISNDLLLDIAVEANTDSIWRHVGYVDASLSESLFRSHPDAIPLAAEGLLRSMPDMTLPHLLRVAADHSHKENVRARQDLQDWLKGDEPGDSTSIPRRWQLLGAIKKVCEARDGMTADLLDWALALTMTPVVDAHRIPPGAPSKVLIYRGLRTLSQLKEIALLWPEVLALCKDARVLSRELRGTIEDWCFPTRNAQRGTTEETLMFARSIGSQVLTDVQQLGACGRACRSWIRQTSGRAGLDVKVKLDRTFERIFRSRDFSTDWQTQQKRRERILVHAADQLAAIGPEEAIRLLVSMEQEAAEFGWQDGYDRHFLYDRLARSVDNVVEWLRVALGEKLPPPQLKSFLDVAVRQDSARIRELLLGMLKSDDYRSYRQFASLAVVSMAEPERDLLNSALDAFEVSGHASTFELVHAQPSVPTLLRLLHHANRQIRIHAALSEWIREPRGVVREALQHDWRTAVLDARDEYEYALGEVLAANDELAFDWALRKIEETNTTENRLSSIWKLTSLFSSIASRLNVQKRWLLLERVRLSSYCDEIVETLLLGDQELFRRWLWIHMPHGESGRYLALRPLDRQIDEIWEHFALVAVDEGVSPEELARHIHPYRTGVISGPFSAYYLGLIPRYERLARHPDDRLRPAGIRGLGWAESAAARELHQERVEAIRGH